MDCAKFAVSMWIGILNGKKIGHSTAYGTTEKHIWKSFEKIASDKLIISVSGQMKPATKGYMILFAIGKIRHILTLTA